MSIIETIYSLATGGGSSGNAQYVITRTPAYVFVDGIAVANGASTTLRITAIAQPATGMNRVVGGQDTHEDEYGGHVDDVRQIWTDTLLFPRTPQNEPDVLTGLDGKTWEVFRVESWELSGQKAYRCVLTARTGGAS